MDIFYKIDEIFDIIQDPRNIDPDDFAEFYPNEGQLGNKKKLPKKEISSLFQTKNRFKKPSNWSGHKPLYSKYHLLIALCEKLTSEDLDTVCGYFASRCLKNNFTFLMDFWKVDGLLSKNEIGELIGMYTVFCKHLLAELSHDIENAISHKAQSCSKDIAVQKRPVYKPTAALTLVKLIVEGNIEFKKISNIKGEKEYKYFNKKYYNGTEVSKQIGEDHHLDERLIRNFRQNLTDTSNWFISPDRQGDGVKNLFGSDISNLIRNLNYLIETDVSLKPTKSFIILLENIVKENFNEVSTNRKLKQKESLQIILKHLNQK